MRSSRAKFLLAYLFSCGLIGLSACGDDEAGNESGTEPEATVSFPCSATADPASGPAVPCPQELDPVPGDITVKTDLGSFVITLDTERAPATTTSFRYLAERGFYDGLDFHRIAPGFVIQGGDPAGNGNGGPGYSVVETPPSDLTYEDGTVAMAKAASEPPGTSGSQFFVVTGSAGLPPEYALVGQVTSGFGTLKQIEDQGQGQGTDGPPSKPVEIKSMTFEAS